MSALPGNVTEEALRLETRQRYNVPYEEPLIRAFEEWRPRPEPESMTRHTATAQRLAKNAVAAELAARIEVQVAYAIGKAAPVGLFVETFGTEAVDLAKIQAAISKVFDLRPGAIIRDLDLLRPIYAPTAAYGHFGRTDLDLSWDRTDRADALKTWPEPDRSVNGTVASHQRRYGRAD